MDTSGLSPSLSALDISASPSSRKFHPLSSRNSGTSLPPVSASRLLSFPSYRPGRRSRSVPLDPSPTQSYGDSIRFKAPNTIRIFFQNVKGLTHSTTMEDYRYYLSCIQGYDIDIAGLSETNTCWAHYHLTSDFRATVRSHYRQNKIVFGTVSPLVDPCKDSETFQSGGNLTMALGGMASRVSGSDIVDPTGLARWSGFTLEGTEGRKMSIITAYRVCSGSPATASLGSAFLREYEYFRERKYSSTNPRRHFLTDLQTTITSLQDRGHSIILMLDANATLSTDSHFADFVQICGLQDLHAHAPATSTFIGSQDRRIDFIFGCETASTYVTRSGTLSYTSGPQSDHRSLYVDIHHEYLRPPPWNCLTPSVSRSLHTGNPEIVESYQHAMMEYYEQHNMVSRIDALYEKHATMSRHDLRQLLIQWDNDQGRAMEKSERLLRKPPKKCAWSPALRNSAIIRRYWLLRLRELNKDEDYTSTFQRWQSQVQVHDSSFRLPHLGDLLSLEQVREHLNRSTRTFRRLQKQSTPLRLQTYQDLLASYEDDDDPGTREESRRKAKIVRNTLAGEGTRHIFSNLRQVLKPSVSHSLSKVLVPQVSDGETSVYRKLQEESPDDMLWETVVDRDALEQHILQYNHESFRAAAESPCGHGVIHDALTFTSLSKEAEELLYGTVPSHWYGQDDMLKHFLASFAIPAHVQSSGEIPSTVSEADVMRGFNAWKETTSTSPSGRHLGHYKALVRHPTLLACLTKFLNIVISRGIAIPRWCNATNVMIEKDSGKPRIHRLRIVHLFEADFNFFLKLQWGHRLVRQACTLNLLHDSQHGSIPRRTAMDPIMLTQLTTDLCRILKHDLARFDNDASACYDRIIVALAMLAARRCGMPKNAVRLHADALKFMKYTIKTIYGVSEGNYHGTVFAPLFGTGQGSGASPSAWLSLVVLLLQTLDRLVPDRINFDPISGARPHARIADAFVDDTNVGFTSSDESTYEDIIARLQHIAQTWEHLLYLSGGKLNLKKCSWYVLRWEWKNGRPVLRQIQPEDPKVVLRQGNSDVSTEIPRVPLDKSSRMLGVMLNPMGDFTDHLKLLKEKADGFARRLLSPRISESDVTIFHRSLYIPSMRYSLAAIAADEESLQSIQSKVVKSILQKMHVSSTIPTSLRHGPVEMGGLGLYDLRTEAGLEALKFFRNALYTNSEAGNLIRLNLQYSQRESGVGFPLLSNPTCHIPYLTPSWVLSVRQFLSNHNMHVTVSDVHIDELKSTTDEYIMNEVHLQRYSASQQKDINLVRLWLQVTTLADMVDCLRGAKYINLNHLDGKRSPLFTSDPKWPRQKQPTKQQCRLWKRYIRSSFLRYTPYWKTAPVSQLPLPPPPTTVDHSMSQFAACIRQLPRTQRRLLDGYEQVATDQQVWNAFRSRARLHLASDGGLNDNLATHGWILSTGHYTLFRCSGPVDGPFDTNSSTRSELGGCASALILLVALSRFWGTRHRCSFQWYTDSRSAISRIRRFSRRHSRATRMPFDADLLSLIASHLKLLRRPFRSHWVKAHQDTLTAYDSLPLAARLNVDADFLATRYRQRGRLRQTAKVDHVPDQQCSFYINGDPVTSQYDDCVRFHVNGYHYRQHVQQHHQWNDKTWDAVDIQSFGKFYQRLQPALRVQHFKLVHDLLPLGTRRYREAPIKDDMLKLCPCCQQHEETTTHFLRCSRNPCFHTSLQTLKSDICTSDVHPLRYILSSGVHHWSTSDTPFFPLLSQYPPHFQTELPRAISSQLDIGWDNCLKGFFSTSWSTIAELDMVTGRKDSRLGASRLKSIHQAFFDHTRRMWLSRNSVLHSKDDASLLSIRSAEAAEIQYFHSRPHLLRLGDQHYCNRPLSALLSSNPATRRRWLRKVKQSSAELTKDGTRQSLLTSFFPSVKS